MSRQQGDPNGTGLSIHQKSSGTVVNIFSPLLLRNVPLPFWPVSAFPNTIFGIRGVEKSRRRVRAALAYYVSYV